MKNVLVLMHEDAGREARFQAALDLTRALDFVVEGNVRTRIETQALEAINGVFHRLEAGKIDGRVVLTF